MTSNRVSDQVQRKQAIRERALAHRNAQPNKDQLSQQILTRCLAQPEYAAAQTVMFYVDVRSEVRTRHALSAALAGEKRIVVPYCTDDRLDLFHLEQMDELQVGRFQILEPRAPLRTVPAKQITVTELDLVLVPGVAFSRRGARIGHGQGFFDKLLGSVRASTLLFGLAFECQVFDEIPTEEHDIFMDRVITETAFYPCASIRVKPH